MRLTDALRKFVVNVILPLGAVTGSCASVHFGGLELVREDSAIIALVGDAASETHFFQVQLAVFYVCIYLLYYCVCIGRVGQTLAGNL